MNMLDYAQRIIDASDRIASARDPDAALAALEEFELLTADHNAQRMMASAFLLCASVIIDDGKRENKP